jgi:RNA 3'-terminal phosphate cyclase (ATP)
MENNISIDGSLYEGGGQIIRSALVLSNILKKPFYIHSIRNNRPNPGLNNQLISILAPFMLKTPPIGTT